MIRLTACVCLLCGLLGQQAWCGDVSRASKAASVAPFPDVVAMAQTNEIPIQGIDSLGEPGKLEVGDSFTALITHFQKGIPHQQWLLYLQAVEPDSKIEGNTNHSQPMVLYTSAGSRQEFVSEPAPVTLRTIGPFNEPGKKHLKAADERARFTLNKGFLGLGLDRTASSVLKMSPVKTNMPFFVSSAKFSDAQIVDGRKVVAARGITPDDERALAGSIPALTSYFSVVQETKGLGDIMESVVDAPSLWSVIKHNGVSADIGFDTKRFASVNPEPWGVSTGPLTYDFAVNLHLNNHLAAYVTFVVTTPRPPLLTCGGIIGFLVENPNDPGNFLTLRIVSARKAIKRP